MAFTYDDTTAQNDLIEKVEKRADQVVATGQTVPINRETTYAELVAAMRHVLQRAPENVVRAEMLDGASTANAGATDETRYLEVPLPDDYIRFVRIKLTEWEIAVDDLVDVHTNAYRLQANQYAAADRYHPLAAIVAKGGSQVLECYPTDAQADPVEVFSYIGEVAPENLSDQLILDAVLWDATGRILQEERDEWAEAAFANAGRALEGNRYGTKGEEAPLSPQT